MKDKLEGRGRRNECRTQENLQQIVCDCSLLICLAGLGWSVCCFWPHRALIIATTTNICPYIEAINLLWKRSCTRRIHFKQNNHYSIYLFMRVPARICSNQGQCYNRGGGSSFWPELLAAFTAGTNMSCILAVTGRQLYIYT